MVYDEYEFCLDSLEFPFPDECHAFHNIDRLIVGSSSCQFVDGNEVFIG